MKSLMTMVKFYKSILIPKCYKVRLFFSEHCSTKNKLLIVIAILPKVGSSCKLSIDSCTPSPRCGFRVIWPPWLSTVVKNCPLVTPPQRHHAMPYHANEKASPDNKHFSLTRPKEKQLQKKLYKFHFREKIFREKTSCPETQLQTPK